MTKKIFGTLIPWQYNLHNEGYLLKNIGDVLIIISATFCGKNATEET